MKILISGAGIAGPTLAYWLLHYGFTPSLVEHASALRTGGYIIDFWGTGYDIAEQMGILPEIKQQGYQVEGIRAVDRHGQTAAECSARFFTEATKDRYISLRRSDLSSIIYNTIASDVKTRFGDSITQITPNNNHVQVAFKSGDTEAFDLVIGADGLHSTVRKLAFGPQKQFEKYLNYNVAAFEVTGYQPRDELVYVMYTEVGQQVARFAMRDDRTLFLFIFLNDQKTTLLPQHLDAQKTLLKSRYKDSGWECPAILDQLDHCDSLYFDRVSQIRMDTAQTSWANGRVALVGDAASCVSLLAGQGSSLAMTAAYLLAGELHRAGGKNYPQAFSQYQARFLPFVLKKQHMAERFGGAFAPKTKLGLWFRNQVIRWLRFPFVANAMIGRDLMDRFTLPDY